MVSPAPIDEDSKHCGSHCGSIPDHGTPVEPRIEEVEKPWIPSVSFDSISGTGELALASLLQLRESVCELQAMT